MNIAFIILLVIHGLLHLLGFSKAFAFYNATQLTQTISKPMGILWLLAFLSFVITAFLFAFKNSYWWFAAFIAIGISQGLILLFWQDAKFGTFANVIILVATVIGFGSWSFYQKYKKAVEAGKQQREYFQPALLQESDMAHLPEAVKKYLRFTGSVGKPKVNHFKIVIQGKIRKNEQSEWMPFTSEQNNFMATPTRLFFMKAEMKKLPVAGYHCFKNGIAFMDIRLFSLFKVQYQDGQAMNKAETVTFLNDMCCMAPATLIDQRITWQTLDENRVQAIFTSNGISISAQLTFNQAGQLIHFTSNDRYNADAEKILPWSTPLREYRVINGYQLPGYAEAIYSYPDKELCYGIFQITSVEYY